MSEGQELPVSAWSDKILDMGPVMRWAGRRAPATISALVVQAFSEGSTLQVVLRGSADEDFTDSVVLATSEIMQAPQIKTKVRFTWAPKDRTLRYARLRYIVDGSPTTGRVTAGLLEPQAQDEVLGFAVG